MTCGHTVIEYILKPILVILRNIINGYGTAVRLELLKGKGEGLNLIVSNLYFVRRVTNLG